MTSGTGQGVLTISVDLELAWGFCRTGMGAGLRGDIERERPLIRRMLDQFSTYDVSATWAVVGHLLLHSCAASQGRFHPEIARPITRRGPEEWFSQHPLDSNDPLWYGRDIVEWIIRVSPRQEICSHSFCHIPYDEAETNPVAVETDIETAKRLHASVGLPFDSFVFPWNVAGYQALLARAGIKAYRGKSRPWYTALPVPALHRPIELFLLSLGVRPETIKATSDRTGMINIPDSMLLPARLGLRRILSPKKVIGLATAAMNAAVRRSEIFHLWFHPSDFVHRSEEQFEILEAILKHAAFLRSQGDLMVLTMAGITRMLDTSTTSSQARRDPLPAQLPGRDQDAGVIRSRAIAHHHRSAPRFATRYEQMGRDRFSSSFAYSRGKLEALLDRYLMLLPKGSRILDVGCGTGEHLRKCARLGFDVEGVEPAPGMRKIAQAANPAVQIHDGLITALPVPDQSFDAVLAIEVLRYLHRADILKAYAEMLRVLKPGGWMFFTMVNRYALNGYYAYYAVKNLISETFHHEPLHCEFVTPQRVLTDLRALRLERIDAHGRVSVPIEPVYRINESLGSRLTRWLEPVDDALSRKTWMTRFAGQLIIVARRPARFAANGDPGGE